MKLRLRKSEWLFLTLGSIMIVGSIALIYTKTSFVSSKPETQEDPFEASYQPIALPSPSQSSLQKAYLLFPAAQAVLTKTGSKAKGYPIKFKFEVEPKEAPCTFVLNYRGEIVISKPLKGSPTGSYQVSILIRKPGLYTWQVKTSEFESELREVTIKD